MASMHLGVRALQSSPAIFLFPFFGFLFSGAAGAAEKPTPALPPIKPTKPSTWRLSAKLTPQSSLRQALTRDLTATTTAPGEAALSAEEELYFTSDPLSERLRWIDRLHELLERGGLGEDGGLRRLWLLRLDHAFVARGCERTPDQEREQSPDTHRR